MSKRKYRIIEEKYEHVSHFYPQYKDENCAYYVLGQDKNGKDITSDYQYFGSWKLTEISGVSFWQKDFFYDLSNARHYIENDIQVQEHTTEELKETIVHEY